MSIKQEDMNYIYEHLSEVEREKLKDTTVLITGCGGFLGYYFMNFFQTFEQELESKPASSVSPWFLFQFLA